MKEVVDKEFDNIASTMWKTKATLEEMDDKNNEMKSRIEQRIDDG